MIGVHQSSKSELEVVGPRRCDRVGGVRRRVRRRTSAVSPRLVSRSCASIAGSTGLCGARSDRTSTPRLASRRISSTSRISRSSSGMRLARLGLCGLTMTAPSRHRARAGDPTTPGGRRVSVGFVRSVMSNLEIEIAAKRGERSTSPSIPWGAAPPSSCPTGRGALPDGVLPLVDVAARSGPTRNGRKEDILPAPSTR